MILLPQFMNASIKSMFHLAAKQLKLHTQTHIHTCMRVHIHMYSDVCVSMHVCGKVTGGHQVSYSVTFCFIPLRQGLSLNGTLSCWLLWPPTSKDPSVFLITLHPGYGGRSRIKPDFVCGDLNSGPHVCTASALTRVVQMVKQCS